MKENYKFVYAALSRACDSMLLILHKGAEYAREHDNESKLLTSALFEDMFDLTRQVQIFSDNVCGGAARAYGITKPSMPDTEKTFRELIERINVTKAFLKTIDPEKFEDEDRKVVLPWMREGNYIEVKDYLQDYILQNTFFHLVTAYDILRNQGVPLGKSDYIGSLSFKNQ